jgi:hypothetical protein
MSELDQNNPINNEENTSLQKEGKESNQQVSNEKGKEKKVKVGKEKKKRVDDSFIIILPEKVKSLRAKVENRIIEILKELILKLIARDPEIKEYYVKTQDISYLQFILWDMAKRKIIYKAKILGDRKHVYFFLPEQLEQIKDKVIKAPKE